MQSCGSWVTALHEVLEVYIGAKDSPGTDTATYSDVINKTLTGLNYLNAHYKAM